MNKGLVAGVLVALLVGSGAARAQLTLTSGLDYSSGKYGSSQTTTVWQVPLMLKYQAAPWTVTAYLPYVNVDGYANPEIGGSVTTIKQSQSGLGDLVIGGTYELFPRGRAFGVDIGLKAKLVTADRSNELLTTGNPDYAVTSNAYARLGRGMVVATVGWTMKGDIRVLDSQRQFVTLNPDNPWNLGVAAAYPLSRDTRIGVAYDWRQKLFADTDAVSEASLLLSHRWSPHWRVQGYVLTGFSNASPDWATGAFLGYTW